MLWDSKKVVLTGESGNVYTLDILAKKGKAKLKGTVKLGAVVTTPKPTPSSGTPKPPGPGSGSGKPPGTGSGILPGSGNPSGQGGVGGLSCSCVATKMGGGGPGPEPGSGTGSGSETGSTGTGSGSEPTPTPANETTGSGYSSLSQAQVDTIIRKSKKALGNAKPAAVRLTFHDCVGGCNGCLNIDNPDNKGLEDVVAKLEEIYQAEEFYNIVSRADVWALMGIWSVNDTIRRNNEDCALYGPNGTLPSPNQHSYENCQMVTDLQVPFMWGRKDCETSPYASTDVHLPAATLGYDGLMQFFSSEFEFTPREVTALMGVHTLGKADIFNSGFHGTWVNNQQGYFNNQYYINIANSSLGWRAFQKPCENLPNADISACQAGQMTGWSWNVAATGFNLNADMAIYKNFSVQDSGEPDCTYEECPLSPTAPDVEEFAQDNSLWIDEFSSIYTKMLAHGAGELYPVE
eukprot:TRINITY_DN207_c0_g1_i12.p1 TRINITY_DN207_c0_g1~~TRINITY_DN207_c0_g1_i12.p1  ORF type:complete len:462 (+),score=130.76 TRINITY_DN207_c0_g1_i12:106-1491(+)